MHYEIFTHYIGKNNRLLVFQISFQVNFQYKNIFPLFHSMSDLFWGDIIEKKLYIPITFVFANGFVVCLSVCHFVCLYV